MKLDIHLEERSRRDLEMALRVAPEKTVKGIRNWVNRTAIRTSETARNEAPYDKGHLKQNIHSKVAVNGLEATVMPTPKYALYVHDGTGIYGPKKRPITPKRGKVLAWESGGQMHYARSVKGIRPNKYMDRAYKAVKPEAERDAIKTLDQIVRSI